MKPKTPVDFLLVPKGEEVPPVYHGEDLHRIVGSLLAGETVFIPCEDTDETVIHCVNRRTSALRYWLRRAGPYLVRTARRRRNGRDGFYAWKIDA